MARWKTPSTMSLKELKQRRISNISMIFDALDQNHRILELIKRKENTTPKEKKKA